MSEYYQFLQGPAKERYVEKLRLVGFTESNDPYSESNAAKRAYADSALKGLWPFCHSKCACAIVYGHL